MPEGMNKGAVSLFVFGLYCVALGVMLLLVPNLLLRTFGAPETNEVWIRLNGMFVLCLGFYYIQAARLGLAVFIRLTVWTRIAVIVFFAAFIIFFSAPKALLLFGMIDLAAAVWTWTALKNSEIDA